MRLDEDELDLVKPRGVAGEEVCFEPLNVDLDREQFAVANLLDALRDSDDRAACRGAFGGDGVGFRLRAQADETKRPADRRFDDGDGRARDAVCLLYTSDAADE